MVEKGEFKPFELLKPNAVNGIKSATDERVAHALEYIAHVLGTQTALMIASSRKPQK